MGADLPHPSRPLPAAAVASRPRRLAGLEWALLLPALAMLGAAPAPGTALSVGAGLLLASAAVRWLRTGRFTHPTALDWPLALFALSGLVALWAAPDRAVALPRLCLFVGALALYYALANSHGQALRLAALGFVALAGILAARFAVDPLIIGLHPNDVACLLGLAAPVALALLAHNARTWQSTRTRPALLGALVAGLALLATVPALVVAQSRTVWLALAAALALAAWWRAAGRLGRGPTGQLAVFWAGVGAAALLAALLAATPWLAQLFNRLPGQAAGGISRFELFGQAWQLARGRPFTGGGLGTFPALYSTYIHATPFFLLAHAHNSYLNLLVEQGWPGLAAYALVLASSALAATRALAQPASPHRALLAGAAAGLVVVVVQGLGDATLVATRFIPFLLVPAGLAVAAAGQAERRPATWPRALAAGAALSLIAAALLWAYPPAQAAWRTNLGLVMADHVLLADWPTRQFSEGSDEAALAPADRQVEAALAGQPNNFAARYYLGLRAQARRDFAAAVEHLAQAYALDPTHRGVIKTLGYTYVWAGRFDDARPLLQQIPEARRELKVYTRWWADRQRADLAANAAHMLALLP